jgi:hypothetical protein
VGVSSVVAGGAERKRYNTWRRRRVGPGVALAVLSRPTRNPEGTVYGIKERAERLSSQSPVTA